MTAEIAIINRSSVTLAADSAMTMSVGGAEKIYTSTDKIFQLSETDPIGIMIYNNLEFMGVPLDVAIKQFRSSSYCCPFKTVMDSAGAFLGYLETEWKADTPTQENHVRVLIRPVLRDVRRDFDRRITRLIVALGRKRINSQVVYGTFLRSLQESIATYNKEPAADCFAGTSEKDLEGRYLAIIDSEIQQIFSGLPLQSHDHDQLRRLSSLVLHRDKYSDGLSGLVFAGFGSEVSFPALISFHIDGIIADKLKKKVIEQETATRGLATAKILPFAQRDIVDRFLVGIDPDMESGISEYVSTVTSKLKTDLFDGMRGMRRTTKGRILQNLDKSLNAAIGHFNATWLPETKKKYRQQTEDIVLFMAKQEAANLAEALVNITSLKRKFSAEKETVAGPIDVAVISKSDGFVWVKRKHYFPSDLNPRYFARRFGFPSPATKPGGHHVAP